MDIKHLTVNQYISINQIVKSNIDELDKEVAICSILTGKPEDVILNMPLPEIKELFGSIGQLNNLQVSTKPNKYINCKGNLLVGCMSVDELSTGQYIDLKTFAKEDFISNLPNMLAVIYRPIFKKYSAKTHEKVSKIIGEAKLNDVYGLLFFYSNVSESLSPTIQMSLVIATQDIEKEMKIMQTEYKDLLNGGDGSM